MPDSAVRVDDLRVAFGDVVAVDGMTWAAPAGAITTLLGPNGAGKTTALGVCEGYLAAGSGSVRVLGRDPRDRELRARVGVMLQTGGVPPGASARETLEHVSRLYANPLPTDALAERLGIAGLGRRPYRRLSGGEQRRLAFALAVVGRPELVVLDEPTTGLDPQARLAVWEVISQLRDAGVTVLLTTHLLEEAERVSDHVVVVDQGRTVAEGDLGSLTASGSRVELRAAPGLDTGALTAALPPGMVARDAGPGVYVVEGPVDASTVASVASWCSEAGVGVTDIGLRRTSLEDVFLGLTGREMRP